MSREYASVSPDKWKSRTGRSLRGNPWAMVIQDYLITCPLSEMTGAYYLPQCMIRSETGIPEEELTRVMQELEDLDFCKYYPEEEYVFVKNMARFQIAATLHERDNRRAKVRKDVEKLPDEVREDFIREYNADFNLGYIIHEDTKDTQKKNRSRTQPIGKTAGSQSQYAPDFGVASDAIGGNRAQQKNGAELPGIEETSDRFLNEGLKSEEIGGLERGLTEQKSSNKPLERGFEGASEGLSENKQAPFKPGTGTGTRTGTGMIDEGAVAQKSSAPPPRHRTGATHRFDLEKIPDKWRDLCENMRPELDPEKVFYEFSAYWRMESSHKAFKSDAGWDRAFLNNLKAVRTSKANLRSAPVSETANSEPKLSSGRTMDDLAAMRF